MQIYQKSALTSAAEINPVIETGFLNHQDDENVRKTHLFAKRYENIYLNETHIPELTALINEAVSRAENILNVKNLRAGYWFNYMPPGSTTTMHTHDDDDELLSGVYYVKVPKYSGNLIIINNAEKIEIKPSAGEFIFFNPDVSHQVSKNNSAEHRLSIGMNFGRNRDRD